MSGSTKDYEIGRGRPPKATQWKKGQSANPGGQSSRRSVEVAEMIDKLLLTPVKITVNGNSKRVAVLKVIGQGLLQGWECAWLAPQHKIWSEAYMEIKGMLRPLWQSGSMGSSVIRLKNGGRLDFWTLGNEIAGRSRRYRRVVIDEAAFAKNGDNKTDGSMMEIWEKAIKPTLFDYGGEVLICSNSAGKNPDNFFYNICTDPRYGFGEFHATTLDNPMLPKPEPEESKAAWSERRERFLAELIKDNDPLVYQQEYLAEFVDWAGVAFFGREKLLENGQPVPSPHKLRLRVCGNRYRIEDRH